MTGDHPEIRVRGGLGILAVAGVLALVGCSAFRSPSDGSSAPGSGAGGTPSATSSAPVLAAKPSAAPKPPPTREPREDRGDCPVGRWRLQSTEATPGGPVENVSFSGTGAFDLTLADGGWRLTGNQKSPLEATVDIAGFPVSGTASIDGTARGRYRMIKSVAVFRLERTSGQVAVSYPGGKQTYGMESLAGALVPDGAADLTCHGNSLTIKAENLTLELRRVQR
jgi:hypothetical protein